MATVEAPQSEQIQAHIMSPTKRKPPPPTADAKEQKSLLELSRRIYDAIDQSPYNYSQIALRIDTTKQTVAAWANGKSTPSLLNLTRLCRLLGRDVAEMLSGLSNSLPVHDDVVKRLASTQHLLPVYGANVGGAYMMGQLAEKPRPDRYIVGYDGASDDAIAIISDSGANEGHIDRGDVAFVDPEVEPQPGDFVFASMGGVYDFRRYYPKSMGTHMGARLSAMTEGWPDHIFGDGDHILGTVIGKHVRMRS